LIAASPRQSDGDEDITTARPSKCESRTREPPQRDSAQPFASVGATSDRTSRGSAFKTVLRPALAPDRAGFAEFYATVLARWR
jgi:hypothetical protein